MKEVVNDKSAEEGKQPTVIEVEATSVKSSADLKVSEKLTSTELAELDYSDFSTPARMLALGTVLAKSSLVPLKSPEDVAVALMTGRELGLPFVTSVSSIYPINGRPTLSVHLQKALCLKHNIIFEKIEDAVEIFQFAQKDKEGKVIMNNKTPLIIKTGVLEDRPENTAFSYLTKRTKYKATRYIKTLDGIKTIVAFGEFSLLDAETAELLDRDVWQKYWKRMLDARALTNVIKSIASDITLGLYTPDELDADYVDATIVEE